MTKFEHKHDVIYSCKCPERNCYESAWRISEEIIYHEGRDKKSHLFTHDVANDHCNAIYNEFIMTFIMTSWFQKQCV